LAKRGVTAFTTAVMLKPVSKAPSVGFCLLSVIQAAAWRASTVTILAAVSYDPRDIDIAEIRAFRGDAFLCRAVCQELAGQTVGFKEVIKARNERRRGLRAELSEREQLVSLLLAVHREDQPSGPETPPPDTGPRLKRYVNE